MEEITEETTQIEEVIKPKNNPSWKRARIGVVIMCVIHFMIAILIGNSGVPTIFNYGISRWFVQDRISQDIKLKSPLWFGFKVSFVIALIQFALGFLYSLFLIYNLKK